MNTIKCLSIIAIVVCVELGQTTALHATPSYHVVDLGSLGGNYSVGLDINNSGQVTGYSDTALGYTHAFLYSGGVMTDLGTLGGKVSFGRSINDSGQVVGDSLLSGDSITATDFSHAFLYSGGVMADLGTLGGSRSAAYGINATGQITGWSSVAGDVFPNWTTRAFLYSVGVMNSLPSSFGAGRSINASGQVVGDGGFLWTPSTPNGTSGSTTPLGAGTVPFGINDSGQVTTVGGTAINASGQIVGGEHCCTPFLYSDGATTNLNTLIDPSSGWVLETANSINDSGWITGKGTIEGAGHAFLLTPVPEPSSLALVGLAIAGLTGRSFNRRRRSS